MGGAEWGLLVLHSALWGSAFFFGAIAIRELPPLTITSLRLLPAVVITLSICLALKHKLPATLREWGAFVLFASVCNVGPFLLILWAQREVTGGIAAVGNATAPLFGALLAHVFTGDEKLNPHKLAGLAAGITGVAILVGGDLFSGSTVAILAKAALLAAAFSYAVAGVVARLYFSHYAPTVLATGQMAGALILSLPLALLFERPWALALPSWPALGAVAGMGLFASALASLCYFSLLQRAGASNALLATILLPLTPIALGALFLGEVLSAREIAGAIVIGAALVMIDGRALAFGVRRGQALAGRLLT
jgi:drug/metabolite transporter (DMT)-like permease